MRFLLLFFFGCAQSVSWYNPLDNSSQIFSLGGLCCALLAGDHHWSFLLHFFVLLMDVRQVVESRRGSALLRYSGGRTDGWAKSSSSLLIRFVFIFSFNIANFLLCLNIIRPRFFLVVAMFFSRYLQSQWMVMTLDEELLTWHGTSVRLD